MDTRVHGEVTGQLDELNGLHVDPADLLDPDQEIPVRNRGGGWVMPDCPSCTERCCVHDEPTSGILLSLRDVAALVDGGLKHLVIGGYTFRRNRHGKILDEIDAMPRLAKQDDGNCHFYEASTGRCNGYGVRPTICRRFPYEIDYRKKSGKPFARFIGWSKCPTLVGEEYAESIRQMARDSIVDENVSFEDAVLLGEHVEELRKTGLADFLPPPEECPGGTELEAARER